MGRFSYVTKYITISFNLMLLESPLHSASHCVKRFLEQQRITVAEYSRSDIAKRFRCRFSFSLNTHI